MVRSKKITQTLFAGLAFALALVLLLILKTPTAGQRLGWLNIQQLNDPAQSAWFPDIEVDASGRVHMVWSEGISKGVGKIYDTVIYTTRLEDEDWQTPSDIVALPTKGAVTRPSLLADPNGVLHMTYRSYSIFYAQAPSAAVSTRSLTPPILISAPENGYFATMEIDSAETIHLIYSENIMDPNCPGCFHLFHRRSMDEGTTWSDPTEVSQVSDGAAKPQLVMDGRDGMHVVWEAGAGGDLGQIPDPTQVAYAYSPDGGQTWTMPYIFPAPGGNARNITLGLDRYRRVVVAYLGLPENIVYYQYSADQGQTWSDPTPIPGVVGSHNVYAPRTDGYSMATDAQDGLHLVFVGQIADQNFQPIVTPTRQPTDTPEVTPTGVGTATPTITPTQSLLKPVTPTPIPGALSVIHMDWNGIHWSPPEAVVTINGDVPEWPRLAVGLGNQLHLTWFVRDEAHIWGGEGAFRYSVWYANKRLDFPGATPVAWARPAVGQPAASLSAPTATLAGQATERPPTATAPALRQLTDERLVYKEQDYLMLILQALFPAILVIGASIAAVKFLRR